MIKKRDIILAFVMILLGIVCCGVIRLGQKKGSQVIIYEDQKEIGRYDLNTDTTKEIQTAKGMNILEIKNGMAYVTEADCPDQVCIRMGKISKTGETIVCLPHKLVIQVEGDVGQKSEYDNR
ncbi:NusG domain II-containing protein [Clostridium sp. AF17-2]|jgi:hypothetical protein|uniref:NusG domain II-containing protein n=1 Tax=unclassified Clostridium TaxID=2614128 RepID=UPI000E502997|nr:MULTISPECIES: NusG domain II-containing protein [unclassified Clostridium]RGG79932.1 NusG domain II-containing protein [Clostridium sp. AF17-21AC]RHR60329.1 NusG domain II-containing protein [Clostridium sp. AF17-2]